jgi:phosphohistidine phosphatase
VAIWFLRHGAAEAGDGDDSARELTEKGRRQSQRAGKALAELGAGIETCLSSPKVRARQTAELACEPLGVDVKVEETEELRGGDFDPDELAAGRGEVLLVGHEPDFSRAVASLTGARVDLKKGGIAVVEDSELLALYRPKDLKAIGS